MPISFNYTTLPAITGNAVGAISGATISAITFSSTTYYNIGSLSLPAGVYIINWQVGINNTSSSLTIWYNFGTASSSAVAPTNSMYSKYSNETFNSKSPCHVFQGTDFFVNITNKNVSYYLNGQLQFTGSGLTLNTTYTYFEAMKIT